MSGSDEMFYLDKDGKKQDAALHDFILDNEKANIASSEAAIKRAIADGVDPELAKKAYGYTPLPQK